MTVSPQRLGRYALSAEIGRGGMGTVYSAQDEDLGREVALKIIAPQLASDPEFSARFLREARIAATLEHPNIVPVYEAGEIDGTLFIAMRMIRGATLEATIQESGPLELPRVVRIARQLGSALDAVHRRGLVHRDVKPANVLLTGGGEDEHVYLADFGLAREAASTSGMTQTGQWIGTLDFVAPEILDGGEPSPSSDVYSLACLLYHAVSGTVPYPGSMARKLAGHAGEQLPSLGDSPRQRALDDVLARGAAKDPRGRYESARSLAGAFERAAATGAGAGSGPPSRVARRDGWTPPPAAPSTLVTGDPDPRATAFDRVRPPASADEQPPSPDGSRRVILAAVIAGVLIVGGVAAAWAVTHKSGKDGATTSKASTPSTTPATATAAGSQFRKSASVIAESAQPSLDALAAAVRTTNPAQKSSLDVLRAGADRALSDLGGALVDLRALDIAKPDQSEANALEAALEANVALAQSLAARRLRVADIEPLAVAAAQANAALKVTALPSIQVDDLIADLKRARAKNVPTDGNTGDEEPVVLRTHVGKGFEALLPTGGGWGEPVESEPEPGVIYRTTVRGPNGALVLVDYTPDEPAVFGRDFTSRTKVDQPVFGTATEYLFSGSKVPECNTSPCVDYIINDKTTGQGFAVLGGGGDTSVTIPMAKKIMESLVPAQ